MTYRQCHFQQLISSQFLHFQRRNKTSSESNRAKLSRDRFEGVAVFRKPDPPIITVLSRFITRSIHSRATVMEKQIQRPWDGNFRKPTDNGMRELGQALGVRSRNKYHVEDN